MATVARLDVFVFYYPYVTKLDNEAHSIARSHF